MHYGKQRLNLFQSTVASNTNVIATNCCLY